MDYTTIVGLEIHAELLTRTKTFCGCENAFGRAPNTLCCPVCLGLPGALPALNQEAVRLGIKAGLALGCEISRETAWDRKNYFYPDLPKGYQTTQVFAPLCKNGGLTLGEDFIRIKQIHLEEDAGKLTHSGARSYVDFNRAGVPLIEIVTEPDLHSGEQAAAFVALVRRALIYERICDGKMEQGSLRVDANISVSEKGKAPGARVEIKNLNSFRFVKRAIESESARQIELLERGQVVKPQTRRFDDAAKKTYAMREKEQSGDYRCCRDPDLPSLCLSDADINAVRAEMVEPPHSRFVRYTGELGLSSADAETLLARRAVSDLFDDLIAQEAPPKAALNAITRALLPALGESSWRAEELPISSDDFAALLDMVRGETITDDAFRHTVSLRLEGAREPLDELLEQNDLLAQDDDAQLAAAVAHVMLKNESVVAQYRAGDERVFSFLVGRCNKALGGRALPKRVIAALKQALDKQ